MAISEEQQWDLANEIADIMLDGTWRVTMPGAREIIGALGRSEVWQERDRAIAAKAWDECLKTARATINRRQGTYEADIDLLALENPYHN